MDIADFVSRAGKEVLGRKSLEALIYAGAMDIFGERNTLLQNIDEIVRASKNEEKRKSSSQLGMFDMGLSDFDETLILTPAPPLSYEQKLFKEREVLGYMVSGHPLDSLKLYCQRRSRSTLYLKEDFEKLQTRLQENEEKFKQDLQKQQVQVVGVVLHLRKIVSKTGKNMLFLSCEGFDYDFEVTIFDRDYEKYKDVVAIGKIVIIEGNLDINFEYRRKSIRPRNIITATLTQVREQARDMGLIDSSKRISLQAISITEVSQEQTGGLVSDTPLHE